MTPKEIVADFVKDVNKRADKVFYPVTKYCDTGLGIPPKTPYAEIPLEGQFCRIFEHRLWQTKAYRDEGCASYQLMRFLKKTLPQKISEIWWRCEPEIEQYRDFDSNFTIFHGYVRFSVF